MKDIEKIDDELYKSKYCFQKFRNYREIWSNIKNNKEILQEAIKIKKDKFNERDILNGITIAEMILIDYESIDENIYKELINNIYNNQNIARLVINGASNGGYSFLLMSLWNDNFKLTESQKTFAVDEAMNKIGTTRWFYQKIQFNKKLTNIGITDEITTYIEHDGIVSPIGKRTKMDYLNYMYTMTSEKQAHGSGIFDIRYCILQNPNWTKEEKQKLIMDFWYEQEEYDEYLDQWEWAIINDIANHECDVLLDKSELYNYTYKDLLEFYNHKNTADRIWKEIEFCKLAHELRPHSWELDSITKKKTLK